MKLWKFAVYGSLLVAVPYTGMAQAREKAATSGSVSSFVQRFYEWYVPVALKDHKGPAWNEVLTHKPALLGTALARALRADMQAQAQARGEIAGLDFDPFLNAQDPCDRYEVGKATRIDHKYKVEIYGMCRGVRNEKPDVVAELAPKGSSWTFANFYYPRSNSDLLTVLRRLHK